jgi:hypothetical protein
VSSLGESIQKLRDQLQSLTKRSGGGSSSGAAGGSAGGKFDAKAALAWAKANPAIVASVGVMLVAPAVTWYIASDLHAQRDAESSKRAGEFGALEQLQKSSVEIALPGKPPEQRSGLISEKTVSAYRSLATQLRTDAQAMQATAVGHNQHGRDKLFVDIKITRENNNTIAETVHSAVMARAAAELKRLRAGGPPADAVVLDQLQRAQDQFIARERKPDRKSLDDAQLQLLRKQLVEKRLQLYSDAASSTAFYADIRDLGLPGSAAEVGKEPSESVFFEWQWRTWIIEDVLAAMAAANKPYKSVIDAPVKRVLSVAVRPEAGANPSAGAAEAPAEPPPADGSGAPVAAAAPSFPPIDPKAPISYDFSKSLTGRVSNQMYDVRYATIRLVVATAALPEVLNAISRQNFMTVTSLDMRPADAFAAADDGYIYGAAPVSEVRMTVESLWLRQWLAKLMPAEVQRRKGSDGRTVDDPPPTDPAAASPAS